MTIAAKVKDKVLKMLKSGKLSATEISEKTGISVPTVYNLKKETAPASPKNPIEPKPEAEFDGMFRSPKVISVAKMLLAGQGSSEIVAKLYAKNPQSGYVAVFNTRAKLRKAKLLKGEVKRGRPALEPVEEKRGRMMKKIVEKEKPVVMLKAKRGRPAKETVKIAKEQVQAFFKDALAHLSGKEKAQASILLLRLGNYIKI